MSTTTIEWATHTANPAGGCTEARLSNGTMDPACVHCYARLQSARVSAMGESRGRTTIHDGVSERRGNTARWTGVLRWDRELLRRQFAAMRAGHRTFVGSMTDLWHPDHDPALLVALAEEIRGLSRRDPEPVVITLTKRADRLLHWQREHFPRGLPPWLWAGVTAGCQEAADERIPLLLQVRSAGPLVLSAEPLTGPLDLTSVAFPLQSLPAHRVDALRGGYWNAEGWLGLGPSAALGAPRGGFTGHSNLGRLGWVIAGGESGPKARPMHPAWARQLRDQCVAAGVPFFFKQWGEWEDDPGPWWDGSTWREGPAPEPRMQRVGKRAAGRLLDGREWSEFPHV